MDATGVPFLIIIKIRPCFWRSVGNAIPSHSLMNANTNNNHKEITIKLYKENNDLVRLIFEDNGIGLPIIQSCFH